ncbi:MAG: hypothetical protein ACT4PZ_14010 [Panacagrimonas sp.]
MKRSMLALVLLVVAGNSWAAGSGPGLNVRGALSTFLAGNSQFPNGLAGSAEAFLAGNITEGFKAGRNGFSGLFVVLTEDTRLAPLGTAAERSFVAFYNILEPLYMALDGPAMRLAALGTPLTKPLTILIVTTTGGIANGLEGSGPGQRSAFSSLPPLPGLR